MVNNLPSSAGDADSIPGQGRKIPHATGQLILRTTTTEPTHHNYWAHTPQLEPMSHNYWSLHAESLCSATRENTTMRSLRTTMKSSPRSPQVEKARAQQWRHGAAKNKKKKINKFILKKNACLNNKRKKSWDYIKLRSLCTEKKINKMKGQTTE